jgi:phage-related protein
MNKLASPMYSIHRLDNTSTLMYIINMKRRCLCIISSSIEQRGDSSIDNFLDELDKKSRGKAAAHLSLLEEQGPHLKRPYADVVRGKIRELRIHQSSNQYRILYFFQVRDQIVLTHGFFKKTQQLKETDIELAERRMEDWLRRFPAGGGT